MTTYNLKEIFKEFNDNKWDLLGRKLRLPKSKRDEIRGTYDSNSERKEAILVSYATEHPWPNWQHVVYLLRGLNYSKQANEVTAKYLSGENS